jgi:endogenous inhibitor of DNA gyrase (YacG/DUF329 family)
MNPPVPSLPGEVPNLCMVLSVGTLLFMLMLTAEGVRMLWEALRQRRKCPQCQYPLSAAEVFEAHFHLRYIFDKRAVRAMVYQCRKCGCRYDKRGNIHRPSPSAALNALDLTRFHTEPHTVNKDSERYQGSSEKEITA